MSWNVDSDSPWSLVVVTWDFKFLGNYIKASVGASWICSNSFKTNKQGDREIKPAHCWWSGNSFLLNAKWPQRVRCLAVSLVFPNYTSQREESLPQGLIPACQTVVCRVSLTGAGMHHGDLHVMWKPDQYRFRPCLRSSVRANMLPLFFLIKGDLAISQINGAFFSIRSNEAIHVCRTR